MADVRINFLFTVNQALKGIQAINETLVRMETQLRKSNRAILGLGQKLVDLEVKSAKAGKALKESGEQAAKATKGFSAAGESLKSSLSKIYGDVAPEANNLGTKIGSAIGGAIGAFFGNPIVGAQVGGAIGGLLQSVLEGAVGPPIEKLLATIRNAGSTIRFFGFTLGILSIQFNVFAKSLRQGLLPLAKVGAEFEKTLDVVKSLRAELNAEFTTNADEAAEKFDSLREKILALSNTTVFTAQEIADAAKFLALAGQDAQQIEEALPKVLELASAGSIGLARATDLVTDTQLAFRLGTESLTRVIDAFTIAQARANTSIEQLGQALKYVSPSASALGISIEETTAALGRLADVGLKGCHDDKTEVLTRRGWIPWPEVSETDVFATVNLNTDELEWHQAEKLHVYDHDGPMATVKTTYHDFCVTGNHRMVSKTHGEDAWGFETADEINFKERKYKNTFTVDGEVVYSSDIAGADATAGPDNSDLFVYGETHYKGKVYCATVPNSTLVTRRNGKVLVSGNSIAGTTLANLFQELASKPKKFREELDRIGVSLSSVDLATNPLSKVLENLRGINAFQAFNRRSARGFLAGFADTEGLEKYIDLLGALESGILSVSDIAETRLANTAGAFQLLQSAIQELQIRIFDTFSESFEESLREIAKFVSKISALLNDKTVADAVKSIVVTVGQLAVAFTAVGITTQALSGVTAALGQLVEFGGGLGQNLLAPIKIFIGLITDFAKAAVFAPITGGLSLLSYSLNVAKKAFAIVTVSGFVAAIVAAGSVVTAVAVQLQNKVDLIKRVLTSAFDALKAFGEGFQQTFGIGVRNSSELLGRAIDVVISKLEILFANTLEFRKLGEYAGEAAAKLASSVNTLAASVLNVVSANFPAISSFKDIADEMSRLAYIVLDFGTRAIPFAARAVQFFISVFTIDNLKLVFNALITSATQFAGILEFLSSRISNIYSVLIGFSAALSPTTTALLVVDSTSSAFSNTIDGLAASVETALDGMVSFVSVTQELDDEMAAFTKRLNELRQVQREGDSDKDVLGINTILTQLGKLDDALKGGVLEVEELAEVNEIINKLGLARDVPVKNAIEDVFSAIDAAIKQNYGELNKLLTEQRSILEAQEANDKNTKRSGYAERAQELVLEAKLVEQKLSLVRSRLKELANDFEKLDATKDNVTASVAALGVNTLQELLDSLVGDLISRDFASDLGEKFLEEIEQATKDAQFDGLIDNFERTKEKMEDSAEELFSKNLFAQGEAALLVASDAQFNAEAAKLAAELDERITALDERKAQIEKAQKDLLAKTAAQQTPEAKTRAEAEFQESEKALAELGKQRALELRKNRNDVDRATADKRKRDAEAIKKAEDLRETQRKALRDFVDDTKKAEAEASGDKLRLIQVEADAEKAKLADEIKEAEKNGATKAQLAAFETARIAEIEKNAKDKTEQENERQDSKRSQKRQQVADVIKNELAFEQKIFDALSSQVKSVQDLITLYKILATIRNLADKEATKSAFKLVNVNNRLLALEDKRKRLLAAGRDTKGITRQIERVRVLRAITGEENIRNEARAGRGGAFNGTTKTDLPTEANRAAEQAGLQAFVAAKAQEALIVKLAEAAATFSSGIASLSTTLTAGGLFGGIAGAVGAATGAAGRNARLGGVVNNKTINDNRVVTVNIPAPLDTPGFKAAIKSILYEELQNNPPRTP